MKVSVEEFLKTAQPKRHSKLEPFREDIEKLKQAGIANIEICRFLELNGVQITASGLSRYLKNRNIGQNTKNPVHKQTIPKKTEETATENRPNWATKKPLDEIY